MQIVEVKNNLVKASYDTARENLILSGFVVIRDPVQSFIGQIIHLDANHKGNFAVIKLLLLFDENGVITNYNGSIPNPKSSLDIIQSQDLLELLHIENPVLLGELAQQNASLKLDRKFLEESLLVCSDKEEDNKVLTKNLTQQLTDSGKKVLIIDLNGNLEFTQEKIIAGKDFKLPLNYETINFIYEKGLEDAKAETKALIQEIFLEIQNYVKTLSENFIPFESFKNVVDSQYEETELVELVLLKNKLLKYYEAGIFAQKQNDFDSLKASIQNKETTIFDLSDIDEKIQREMISYVYSLINELNEEIYVICNIDNENSDKKLLKQIFMAKNAYSTLICSYSYKYLRELKQLSKNLILFAPIQQQNDFAAYNAFLSKLNAHEFIIYGKSTRYLPLIVKLEEMVEERGKREEETEYTTPQYSPTNSEKIYSTEQFSQDDLLDEQIRRDVDEIYTAPKTAINEEISEEVTEDELTEEDLDFIDDLGVGLEESENGQQEIEDDFSEIQEEEIIEENIFEETEYPSPSTSNSSQIEKPKESFEEEAETFSEVLNQQANEEVESSAVAFAATPTVNLATAPAVDILPIKMSSTPIVPIYSADVEPKVNSDELKQGDTVTHPKYGKGTVEKLITYGSKTLCSINFDNIGRRLLDPALAEIKKV